MDKANGKVREALAQKADLLGAVRLPNNAFKANAGTDVTADMCRSSLSGVLICVTASASCSFKSAPSSGTHAVSVAFPYFTA
mgnify:CR=1 FL=1